VSLRHALLALLTAKPMNGYDLAKVFDRSVAYVWHAPHSQIYPELRRMEGEGLVAVESIRRGTKGTKRIYSITEDGRGELSRWIETPAPIEMLHDAERLRAAYLEFGSYDAARRYYTAHRDHYELWERQWTLHADQIATRDTALIRIRLAAPRTGDSATVVAYKVHTYRGLAAQAHLEIEWAKEGLRMVDELESRALDATALISQQAE
jgi:PadR family transcriptional regulator, regulatory protein AphA